MALAPHYPLFIDDVVLELDGTEYSTAVDSVTITTTKSKIVWKPVNGRKTTVVGKADFALVLNLGQDFATTGLMHQLVEGHGTIVPFTVKPRAGEIAEVSGTVTLEIPDSMLGAAETVATSAVTLGIEAAPTFVWTSSAPAGA